MLHGATDVKKKKTSIMSFKKVLIPPNFHKILHYRLIEGCLVNTLRTGDADLRFYITTVQDG